MRKSNWILIFLILCNSFLFTGCKNIDMSVADKIIAPKNFNIPISGKWQIKRYVISPKSKLSKKDADNWIGKTAEFTSDLATFGGENCNNPNYKIKNVVTNDYLLYEYKTSANLLGISNKNIQVVIISNRKGTFYNFIKIKEDEIIVYIEGVFYYLGKITSNGSTAVVIENKEKKYENDKSNQEQLKKSGLLLGLGYPKKVSYKIPNAKEEDQIEWNYRTLWISSNNNTLNDIYETSDLFVPRKTGFWRVGVMRDVKDEYVQDNLFAYPLDASMPNKNQFWNNGTGFISKSITFIGNNYISTEWNGSGYFKTSNALWSMHNLKMLSLDNIHAENGIKISDIFGARGKEALISSGIKSLYSESKELREGLEKVPKEDNFAVVRNEGYWILKGRLNSENNTDYNHFLDFTVNTKSILKLFNYDDLRIPWSEIKKSVPEAVDAYTSPNKDFIIVLTSNNLVIYKLNDNKLSDEPLKQIAINSGEKAVMVEWVTGDYVERWKNSFENNVIRVVN